MKEERDNTEIFKTIDLNAKKALTNLNQLKIIIINNEFDSRLNHDLLKESFNEIVNEILLIQNAAEKLML